MTNTRKAPDGPFGTILTYRNGYSPKVGDIVIDPNGWRARLVGITEDGEGIIQFNLDACVVTISVTDLDLASTQDAPGGPTA